MTVRSDPPPPAIDRYIVIPFDRIVFPSVRLPMVIRLPELGRVAEILFEAKRRVFLAQPVRRHVLAILYLRALSMTPTNIS